MKFEALGCPRRRARLDMSDIDRREMLLVLKALRDARRILRSQGYRMQIRVKGVKLPVS